MLGPFFVSFAPVVPFQPTGTPVRPLPAATLARSGYSASPQRSMAVLA
jgi:hypothetical protein